MNTTTTTATIKGGLGKDQLDAGTGKDAGWSQRGGARTELREGVFAALTERILIQDSTGYID